jgi:indole-3-glycerol phosphate synthase
MSEDFLARMAASSRERLARASAQLSFAQLRERVASLPEPPPFEHSPLGFDLICEVKLRSPAAGVLQGADEDIAARACAYADAGAAAISVLTEPSQFDGTLDHLTLAAQALGERVPVMRKDFLVDPYQVFEARAAGAGGILLVLRMLGRDELLGLLAAASELGLFVLLEAFDEADIELSGELAESYARDLQLLVGVNCRDLTTLKLVPRRLDTLARYLPRGVVRVAESGVSDARDVVRLVNAGYDAALIGSVLMREADPTALTRALLAAGNAAAQALAQARTQILPPRS